MQNKSIRKFYCIIILFVSIFVFGCNNNNSVDTLSKAYDSNIHNNDITIENSPKDTLFLDFWYNMPKDLVLQKEKELVKKMILQVDDIFGYLIEFKYESEKYNWSSEVTYRYKNEKLKEIHLSLPNCSEETESGLLRLTVTTGGTMCEEPENIIALYSSKYGNYKLSRRDFPNKYKEIYTWIDNKKVIEFSVTSLSTKKYTHGEIIYRSYKDYKNELNEKEIEIKRQDQIKEIKRQNL